MTDPMELVGRLETYADPHEEIGMTYVRAALTESAACIREMVEQRAELYRRAERYREQVEAERKAYLNLLADYEGRPHHESAPLPPAPGAEA